MTYFSRLNLSVFVVLLVLAVVGTLERKALHHVRALGARIEQVTR
jgi:hypothetical protein